MLDFKRFGKGKCTYANGEVYDVFLIFRGFGLKMSDKVWDLIRTKIVIFIW
jgi:hypothetical protein